MCTAVIVRSFVVYWVEMTTVSESYDQKFVHVCRRKFEDTVLTLKPFQEITCGQKRSKWVENYFPVPVEPNSSRVL